MWQAKRESVVSGESHCSAFYNVVEGMKDSEEAAAGDEDEDECGGAGVIVRWY